MDYVRDPAPQPSLSASLAHILTSQSPLHAKLAHPRLNPAWQPHDASRFDIGTVAHQVLLEGHWSNVVSVDAEDWRTKSAKETRDSARAQGKIAILARQRADVENMVAVARDAIGRSDVLASVFANGTPEQTLVWQEGGIWLRCRPDWMGDGVIVDYKTTAGSAEPTGWTRSGLLANGYDLQAAINLRGVKALTGKEPTFVFLVQECEAPYAVSLVGMEPAFLAFAERKLDAAFHAWQRCLTTGEWPGYPSQVCYMELPAYAEMQWAEKQGVK
jgi:hypothetical protein